MKYILMILFMLSSFVYGQKYYVSNSGNDTNDGLTTSTPFTTIAKAISVSSAGTTIALNRGDSWRKTLIVPYDSMTIEDYGTGAKPLINGLDTLKTWALANPDSLINEIITNGKFESGITGYSVSNSNGSAGALSWNTSTPIIGSGSLNIANTGISTSTARPIWNISIKSVPAATSIIISFKYRVNSGTAAVYGLYTGSAVKVLNRSLTGTGVFTDTLVTGGALASSLTIYLNGTNTFNFDVDSLTATNTFHPDPSKIWVANSLSGINIFNTIPWGYSLIVDDSLTTPVGSINYLTASYLSYTNRTDDRDSVFQIYIYSDTDPNSRIIQISNRSYGIYTAKKSTTIKNIAVTGSAQVGIFLFGTTGRNSLVDSSDVKWARIAGIELYEGYSNSTVTNCKVEQSGNGIYSASYDLTRGSNSNTFSHNWCYSIIGYSVDVRTDGHGLGVYASDSCIIEYNYVENNQVAAIAADFSLAGRDTSGTLTIRYNEVVNSQETAAGISVGKTKKGTVNVFHNLLVNNGKSYSTGGGIVLSTPYDSTGFINVSQNTVANIDSASGVPFRIYGAANTNNNVSVKGNIFCSIMAGTSNNLFYSQATIKMNVDSNLYYKRPDTYYWNYNGTSVTTLGNWQSTISGAANDSISTLTGITTVRPVIKYNHSSSNVGYPLSGTYIDLRGKKYINSITLVPYESMILFKATIDLSNNVPIISKETYKVQQQ